MSQPNCDRTARLFWPEPDALQTFINEVGYDEFYRALGRLASWAPHRDPEVRIGINTRDAEMEAHYVTDDKVTFVLGAVWREDEKKFTFHS